MGFTDKQKRFIEEYTKDFNATQAALRAGYSTRTAYSIGHENLKKPEISQAIQKRMNDLAMSADEALYRLSSIARGDIADFLDIDEYDGRLVFVDLGEAKKNGKTWLIKSYQGKSKTQGEKIELYDAKSAIETILKIHGKLNSKVEVVTWRDKIIEALRKGDVKPEQVSERLGDKLAKQLFLEAGIVST